LPKKIVVRIPSEPKKAEPTVEQPPVEEIPVIEPPPEEPPKTKQIDKPVELGELEASLENAAKHYEALKANLRLLLMRDKTFQELCRDNQTISLQTIKKILERFNESRMRVVEESRTTLDALAEAKSLLEASFSKKEEELYWANIELNTLVIEQGAHSRSQVGLREELEARIPQFRQELSSLRNRIRELEEKLREVSDLPRVIHENTTYTEIAKDIFEEAKKKYILTYGGKAETMLTADIEKLAQSEKIPREYATILVWKRLQTSA